MGMGTGTFALLLKSLTSKKVHWMQIADTMAGRESNILLRVPEEGPEHHSCAAPVWWRITAFDGAL